MTSAGGELSISPDKIKTHATNVTSAGSGLTEALEAAQAVSAPSDAFGKLCAFLGPLFVDSVETDGIDAIQAAIDAFGNTSSNLTASPTRSPPATPPTLLRSRPKSPACNGREPPDRGEGRHRLVHRYRPGQLRHRRNLGRFLDRGRPRCRRAGVAAQIGDRFIDTEADMTTPSPDREYTRIDGDLPMHFGFKFRPWRYNLSLSELELRSFDRSPEPAFVSIRFFSVFAMKMKTLFNSLTIDLADRSQSLEILRISEVDESKSDQVSGVEVRRCGQFGGVRQLLDSALR
ncbi:hypothetical protein ACGFQG_12040 [Nocardia fluminea]|uniref:hypothetical protein n=1 Tax=Nocardia fluminea TaxID=134984 RepID=UPI00370FE5D4